MIIDKIIIENFLCYYNKKEFKFSEGLNIILGDNGEGKTKFFEAFEWLFRNDTSDLEKLVSSKALAEVDKNDTFKVSVKLAVAHMGEKIFITKSFNVKKIKEKECECTGLSIEGIKENRKGERIPVEGKELLDRIFPVEIRKYSMFKGEDELNIFRNTDTLGYLIKTFSSAKYFDIYSEKIKMLKDKAEKAVNDATKLDKSKERELRILESEIEKLAFERAKYSNYFENSIEQIEKLEENIADAERFVSNAEALETIKKRIEGINQRLVTANSQLKEDYTVYLFDENWILQDFEAIQQLFVTKVNEIDTTRRALQTEYDVNVGIKKGKVQAAEELLKVTIPLPIDVPSKRHMEEMLKEEICKVCNRPAKKNSKAYEFMVQRLSEFIKSQEPISRDEGLEETLYTYNYTNELIDLSNNLEKNLSNMRSIKSGIKDLFKFNKVRKIEIEELNVKLEKEKDEIEKILGSSTIGHERLSDILLNYRGWQKDLGDQLKDKVIYENKVREIDEVLVKKRRLADEIRVKSVNSFLIKTRNILADIEVIINDTREKKYNEFIEKLQKQSNVIFQEINIDDFTGEIVFRKKHIGERTTVSIELQEDGRIYHKPNQSLLTSMHIAILFAISDLTKDVREEAYPMIMDAPTSSFGESKTKDFLNLIYESGKQIIILTYLFVARDSNQIQYIKPEFQEVNKGKAFWIRRQRPFDKQKLETINTEITEL